MARIAKDKTSLPSPAAGKVVSMSSTEAQNALGHLLDRVARGDRVVVTRYNRPQAVILSVEEYDALLAEDDVDLSALEREFDEMVAQMQTAEHRDAVEALFKMSGDEPGEATMLEPETARDDR